MAVLAVNGGEPVRTEGWPQWPPDDPGFIENLTAVIESGVWGTGGEWTDRACEMMAEYHGAKYAVACTSGTTALELALRAVGVGVGDEVIVPPYTFIATASSVVAVGAVPIFVDIDAETFNLDPALIEDAVTERTRAVIAVHIGGSPADMDAVMQVAKKHDLAVIEDCAQAHGAVYKGRRIGAIGDAGAFSFQSSKNVTAGEGGMILTNSREIYEHTWSTVNVGRVQGGEWYDHRVMGWNYRMTQFQAALICRGMELLPGHFERRARNGDYLRERLRDVEGIELQKLTAEDNVSAFHLYIFRYDEEAFGGLPRDEFLRALGAEGIGASRGYNPLYREGVLANYFDASKFPFSPRYYDGKVNYNEVSCPACEHICERGGFWMSQRTGLADEKAMDDIADAMLKIQRNVGELLGE
ncbi:MAG: DegT/DnrJ/EryC1/StrS family aminotransferase [Armatimonadetes bacterium]|nr:DegT/DnrJ/EryC1/StrS family aminotransferase [Armatimonadota bacterium]